MMDRAVGRTLPPVPARRPRVASLVVILGVLALLAGLCGGLMRLGWRLPSLVTSLSISHGPLMVLGFLGTLISLERAVALGRRWGYAGPLLSGLGALVLLAGGPTEVAAALMAGAGLMLVAVFARIYRFQPALHISVMWAGAVAWVVAAVLWFSRWPVYRFVPWLAGFLVLTIVGERLELSRLILLPRRARVLFLGAGGLFSLGLAVSVPAPDAGVRLAGVGLVALAVWLLRFDVARRTVRRPGLTRFMALCLLAGYLWLAAGGVAWVTAGALAGGFSYDAGLHALFLGFVMSMVMGHAPVIVPAVLRVPVRFGRWFYAHLALLHASLLLRVVGGDLGANATLWRWGGLLNVVAVLWFLAAMAWSTRRPPAVIGVGSRGVQGESVTD